MRFEISGKEMKFIVFLLILFDRLRECQLKLSQSSLILQLKANLLRLEKNKSTKLLFEDLVQKLFAHPSLLPNLNNSLIWSRHLFYPYSSIPRHSQSSIICQQCTNPKHCGPGGMKSIDCLIDSFLRGLVCNYELPQVVWSRFHSGQKIKVLIFTFFESQWIRL